MSCAAQRFQGGEDLQEVAKWLPSFLYRVNQELFLRNRFLDLLIVVQIELPSFVARILILAHNVQGGAEHVEAGGGELVVEESDPIPRFPTYHLDDSVSH